MNKIEKDKPESTSVHPSFKDSDESQYPGDDASHDLLLDILITPDRVQQ